MKLYHRDLGGAGNPPLVILHGMLGSSRNWQTAGTDLAARYHVLALDLRNHGRSPHSDTMTYEAMVDDVIDWLGEQRLERVTLMGHSMGGKAAMLLACRHPERVDRLWIVDIAPKDYFWVAHRANFAAMNELDLADLKSRGEAELRFEARVHNWAMRKFLATNLEQGSDGRWRWMINLPVITKAVPILEAKALSASDRFEGPVTFFVGGASNYVGPDDVPELRTHFPRADLVTIPESGHNPHMETRAAFVQAVFAAG